MGVLIPACARVRACACQVRINYVKLGGYVAFGLGAHDIHK